MIRYRYAWWELPHKDLKGINEEMELWAKEGWHVLTVNHRTILWEMEIVE